jgi:soluble lytic murein transglycosylase-like protein/Zn-dependent protease with chaperone function
VKLELLDVLAASLELQAFVWTLLHFSWQGALIAGALWLLLAVLPPADASARYTACCAALALMLLAPWATLWLLLTHAASTVEAVARVRASAPEGPGYLHLVLLAAWLLGSASMSARLAFGVAQLQRMVRRAQAPEVSWQRTLARLARQVGVQAHVRLLCTDQIDAPVSMGWLRPVILVPFSALTSLPPAYLEALLAHELGHVRRLDYLVNLVQSCVQAALFYHPAVHWVSRRMRIEREHCCDDIAIRISGDALGYARALAEMERLRAKIPEPALAANGGSLMLRIQRITRFQIKHVSPLRAGLTASGLLASALCLSLAGAWACSTAAHADAPAAEGVTTRATSIDAELAINWLPPTLERYEPALASSAHRYGLDPALLAIVALVESLGDPDAQSPSGAIGLMQLMPSTAAEIARERQLAGHSEERLRDPDYNIDFGAWYLSRQISTFAAEGAAPRSVELAAVAYNGGPKLARAYLEHGAELPREVEQYRDLVVGMWNERTDAESPTYAAWRERLRRSP